MGTTIESRIRWLLKLYDQREVMGRRTEDPTEALRCEMAVFIDPMLDPKKGPVSLIGVKVAGNLVGQICQGLHRLATGRKWTCKVSTEYRLQIPRKEQL